jgi:hypothetical protein
MFLGIQMLMAQSKSFETRLHNHMKGGTMSIPKLSALLAALCSGRAWVHMPTIPTSTDPASNSPRRKNRGGRAEGMRGEQMVHGGRGGFHRQLLITCCW